MVTKMLFFIVPLTAAIGTPLWMAYCRRNGRHWVLAWLITLLPLGAVLALNGLGLMASLDNSITLPLIMVTAVGLAAFAGGAAYLGIPLALAAINETANDSALRERMSGQGAPKRDDRREEEDREREYKRQQDDDDEYYEDQRLEEEEEWLYQEKVIW